MINLGCGLDDIFSWFLKISNDNETVLPVHWIGVDLSDINIETCTKKNRKKIYNSKWIQADAVDFAQAPEKYLDAKTAEYFNSSDVYVIASGLLTTAVITYAQGVRIMQSLKNIPRLKSVILTGLQQSHISAYIAKQIGFKPQEMFAHYKIKQAIEGFTPITALEQKQRILRKAKKYNLLDLSFMTDLSLMEDLDAHDLKNLGFVLLAGITLNTQTMNLLNRWININPHLLFVCAAFDAHEAEQLYLNISTAQHRWKFISFGVMETLPMYSHHFYDDLDMFSEKGLPLHHSIKQYERILLKRLFIALNQDRSPETNAVRSAKNDIHKILNNKAIDTEDKLNTSQLLVIMHQSGISDALIEALEDYIRIVPIDCFTDQEYWESSYQMHFLCGDTTLAAFATAQKLHDEGVFTAREWQSIFARFTEPTYQKRKPG